MRSGCSSAAWARDNQAEAVQLEVAAYPELKADVEAAKWAAYSAVLTNPIGTYDPAPWNTMQDIFLKYKAIKSSVDVTKVFTDKYLPEAG